MKISQVLVEFVKPLILKFIFLFNKDANFYKLLQQILLLLWRWDSSDRNLRLVDKHLMRIFLQYSTNLHTYTHRKTQDYTKHSSTFYDYETLILGILWKWIKKL